MSLEVQSATLAARRATRAGIAALESAIAGHARGRRRRQGRHRRRASEAALPRARCRLPRGHRAVERQPADLVSVRGDGRAAAAQLLSQPPRPRSARPHRRRHHRRARAPSSRRSATATPRPPAPRCGPISRTPSATSAWRSTPSRPQPVAWGNAACRHAERLRRRKTLAVRLAPIRRASAAGTTTTMSNRQDQGGRRLDDAARAGWLYYVAGNNQEEIARKLNVSRQTAQRLVSLSVSEGPDQGPPRPPDRPLHGARRKAAAALRARPGRGRAVRSGIAARPSSASPRPPPPRSSGGCARASPIIMAIGTGRTLKAAIEQLTPMEARSTRSSR